MEFQIESRLVTPPTGTGELVIQSPPDVPRETPGNPLSTLLPAAMGIATAGMMVVYFTSSGSAMRSPIFMFFPAMMLVSLLGTVLSGARGGNRMAEINQNRRDYLRYLMGVDVKILDIIEAQRCSLEWHYPAPGLLWTMIGSRRMWERRPEHADFGHGRVGRGARALSTPLVAPDLGPDDERDPVTSTAVQRLIRHRSMVPELPISVALTSHSTIAVDGDISAVRGLIRAVLCHLAVMHSPRELRIAAVVDPLTAGHWDWLKWLPHHRHPSGVDGGGQARMTFFNLAAADSALASCEGAHCVLLIDCGLIASSERHYAPREADQVTVLHLGGVIDDAADLRITVNHEELAVRTPAGDEVLAHPDAMTTGQACACARRLARFRPAAGPTGMSMPHSPTSGWSELMGIDDVGGFDPAAGWQAPRTPGQQLRVPIGVSEGGEPIELDIKEAAADGMGPHGLCVGATGSGKSEFLRTLTLGMVTAHPPERLNLVLVDFKGGATFLGLERAPHVAAVITNLADEAHLVARMKDALAGEMNRRQELLRAAGNFANLAEYDQARRTKAELAPLPALFIVVDEFSELLSQHPDFIDLFIAVGRLGRSLGMHLLLASQRLDEGRLRGLESHLSYRVCLKTFSAAESRSILGVPDAYHLPSAPGAAYLKSGADEPIRFQAAYVSGPSKRPPSSAGGVLNASAPRRFTAAPLGRIAFATDQRTDGAPAVSRTVLDAVLDRLEGRGAPAHQVWLPPLTDSPDLELLLRRTAARTRLAVPIGVIDCPFQQRRELLIAQLHGATGNLAVVGGPQSGKSAALQTLVLAMARMHDPHDVQIYCLDFGGGALSSLAALPHVGSVAGRHDVDLVRRTVSQLESLLRARELQRTNTAGPYGDVFLVVDGWGAIRRDFEHLEAAITALAAQGLSHRIHVVISASRWSEIRPALKDQLGTRIELRLGDPAESEMDRKRARQLVERPPGRGITRDGREFAIATPRLDSALVDALMARFGGRVAPPIEVLPTRVDHDSLVARSRGHRSPTKILIGIGEVELEPVVIDFAAESNLIILGQNECGKTAVLRTLCLEIVRTNSAETAELFIVDYRRSLLGVVESDHLAGYTPSAAALTPQLAALIQRLQTRMPGPEVSQQQLRTRSWWSGPEVYIVVDDYDLMATPSGGNPLAPLLDFLPHAKDLGLHLVVARRSGGAARGMFDPVLGRMRELGCMGLMMSASPDEGVLLGSARPGQLPPGRGTLVTRAHPEQLVQTAWSDPV